MNRYIGSRLSLCLIASAAWLGGCQSTQNPGARSLVSLNGGKMTADAGGASSADALVAEGRSLEQRGAPDAAAHAFEQAVRLDPNQGEACWRLAVLYDKQGRWADSLACYRKALSVKPGTPDIYCDMGYSLYLQHRWPEAEMNLRQALALQKDNRRAHVNLGLLLARTDRVEEALVEFRTANCDVADAHVNVAYALSLDGHWDEARSHYQRALAADTACESARKGLHEVTTLQAQARGGRPASTATADSMLELTSATNTPADPNATQAVLPARHSGP